ncbi:MAG TPA: 4Fe-4S dicluster domain-containing protein [Terriglobales bacterium]|nr:4Fe-4S dicluster domain-containing protein [Terriglobales bacterium]
MAASPEMESDNLCGPGAQPGILAASKLDSLIAALLCHGYQVIGPMVRDGAIVLDTITSADQIPRGWTDEQQPAHYRLTRRSDEAFFAYGVGPHSWKRYLHPPDLQLCSAERQNGAFRILNSHAGPKSPLAFLGVRACDLTAIAIQDRILLEDKYRDPIYGARRQGAFIVAVQCTRSVSTCFCASMGTGPAAHSGFDLCLTEIVGSGQHRFIVQIGSRRGAEIASELEITPASETDVRIATAAIENAAHQQVRKIEADGLRELLYRNFEHPHWEKVAARCLSCANCTLVCPTCFCTTVEDTSDVAGKHAERWRRWDSCFTLNFSYIHGGSIRASGKARYRQWLTHKFASWIDQFGTPGCVGCGRCITWCPAGIDITEEIRALQEG